LSNATIFRIRQKLIAQRQFTFIILSFLSSRTALDRCAVDICLYQIHETKQQTTQHFNNSKKQSPQHHQSINTLGETLCFGD
jgi:hypothetical protein